MASRLLQRVHDMRDPLRVGGLDHDADNGLGVGATHPSQAPPAKKVLKDLRNTTGSRLDYDSAPRTLSWINPAIRARVSIAIDENSAGVFGTIGPASVNGVRA
jgi:hypothetical protein